jgi:AcrR family transcriptional regulator
VQAPAIYRLFRDKDGLLEAVAEHVMATYVSTKAAIVRSASADEIDPPDDLRSGWQMQLDFGVTNPALFRDPDRVPHSPAAQSGRRGVTGAPARTAHPSVASSRSLTRASGARICQASVTSSPRRSTSTLARRSITRGRPS